MHLHPSVRIATILLLACAVPAAARAQGGFLVSSCSPANNARGISAAATVTLQFNAAVNPATVIAQNLRLAGRWSGPVPATLAVGAGGTSVTLTPARPLFASEQAYLWVSSAVQSTAAQPLTGGFAATWMIDSIASSGGLVLDHIIDYRMPGEGLIRTYGFFAGDIDRDGSPDMSATNEVSFDIRLWKNNGAGTFSFGGLTSLPAGNEPSPNEGADLNGDGWIDLVTGNQNGQSVAVFLNSGLGGYLAPAIHPAGGQVHGVVLLDADADGDIDIVAANFSNLALFRNNGNGTFQAATVFNGGGQGEWCVASADANGDGRPDLFCGNFLSGTVALLLNDGTGVFTISATRTTGGMPWQMAAGDVDGDGNADVVVANNNAGNVAVVRGNGAGGLAAAVTYSVGSAPVSIDLGDLEGDDDLDIVVANFGSANGTVLRNQGNGTYANATNLPASSAGSCAVVVDYDRDGDTDVILVDELDDKAFVYRQPGPTIGGVQSPSAAAALRIDAQAGRAGFGGRPAHPIFGGSTVFVNVSGAANVPLLLAAGAPQEPGVATAFGLVNIQLAPLPLYLVDGFGGNPAGVTNAFGEAFFPFPLPPSVPTGATLTLQALLSAPSLPSQGAISNPETVVFQ